MQLTPERIKALLAADPKRVAFAFQATLRDFGYDVRAAYVETEAKRLLEGGRPKGGPSMFIAGWLKEGMG